jgi:hypothetical protein
MSIEQTSFRLSAPSLANNCAACRYFTGAPAALERAIPGLNILSSAYGSVRGKTGLCERHDTFTTAGTPACPQFETNRRLPQSSGEADVTSENPRSA